jgi:hypothetical protein
VPAGLLAFASHLAGSGSATFQTAAAAPAAPSRPGLVGRPPRWPVPSGQELFRVWLVARPPCLGLRRADVNRLPLGRSLGIAMCQRTCQPARPRRRRCLRPYSWLFHRLPGSADLQPVCRFWQTSAEAADVPGRHVAGLPSGIASGRRVAWPKATRAPCTASSGFSALCRHPADPGTRPRPSVRPSGRHRRCCDFRLFTCCAP